MLFHRYETEAKLMNLLKKREQKKAAQKRLEEREKLRRDMERLEEEIRRNEILFNFATDEYLIESIIFEHNAQTAKMNYLLKQAKEI